MKKTSNPGTENSKHKRKDKKSVPDSSAKKKSSEKTKPRNKKNRALFPVVAIGASAGGIEAISNLLQNLSPRLGMAYVIIQHLSPNHDSILPELLERKTKMAVHQVEGVMPIRPDNVYVIPPNTYMSIEGSMLKLSPRIKMDGNYHSIDFFLNSLASVYKDKAIAIILSGIASDGTVGIQSIKAEGGITFAQNATAKFQGMPKNAADSGFIDFILSPEDIAKQLQAFPKVIYSISKTNKGGATKLPDAELKKIFFLLFNKKNVDFSYYKPSTVNRRILRRMVLNRITKPHEYIKFLQENTDELNLLYKDLLINVTSFFRDKDSYTTLTKKIFRGLMKDRAQNIALRIWIPACSSGEEAYSIAICLFEFLKDKALSTPIQIFATDLSETAIERARSGVYPKGAMQNVSSARLKKYFVKIDGSYQVTKAIRDVCIFATHDLLKDPPFSRMDLISCQNVLIYFESDPQRKILQAFHYALRPSGYLLLGKSETIGNSSTLFTPVGRGQKIYVKKNTGVNGGFDFAVRSYYPVKENRGTKKMSEQHIADVNIDKETERLLLSRYGPPSLLVDKDLQIQRFIGATSSFLQPVAGKASLHLLKMVRDELLFDIRSLLQRAKNENRSVKKRRIAFTDRNSSKDLSIEVIPINSLSYGVHYLIVFEEEKSTPSADLQTKDERKSKKDSKDKRIDALESQLREAQDHVKIISEEFEATREELQSSNEEVLSSNEELQSINEEIETSKEELQSTNEELTTINEEVERRNNDLRESVEFSDAILQTINEPLIVLYPDMRVRMANRAFYKIFKTRESAVEGLSFFEISNYQWDIQELRKKLNEVFSLGKNFEQFELEHVFPLLGERILRLNAIRINKDDPKKNALLLVLEDITQSKKAETRLRESEERFRLLVQNASDIITILSAEGVILYESESVEHILGYSPKDRIGKNIFKDTIVHPDDIIIKESAFKTAIAVANKKVKAEFRLRHKDGSYREIEAVYVNLTADPRIGGIVANYHDVTQQRTLERHREEFISIASHELKTPITSLKGYVQIMQDMFSAAGDSMSTELTNKLDVQVNRLNNLIKDLLDLTRIRHGQLEMRKSNFKIDKLIDETVAELQLASKKHLIVADLNAGKKINADKERIVQVLNNLVSNAVKYSPRADKIIINSSATEEIVTICVQDFGIGISAETQKKIFDRFFRLYDNKHSYPGLGLGLHIASEIVKQHRGSFSVKSELGQGSIFCFTLPCK